MNMYLFTMTTPGRDGDFDTDIVAHEYTHGISNRLTGGPNNTDCLDNDEGGGMGEGWSDFVGIFLSGLVKQTDTREKSIGMGVWAFTFSIRYNLYSTNMTTNPTVYSYLDQEKYNSNEHHIGEIWANMLYEMFWNVVDATGKWNPDWYSADKTAGNTLALQIVIDGLKLQPCNPSFLQARDAVVQAERLATGGTYQCEVWKAFAKRGMGPNASDNTKDKNGTALHVDDFTLPAACVKPATT